MAPNERHVLKNSVAVIGHDSVHDRRLQELPSVGEGCGHHGELDRSGDEVALADGQGDCFAVFPGLSIRPEFPRGGG